MTSQYDIPTGGAYAPGTTTGGTEPDVMEIDPRTEDRAFIKEAGRYGRGQENGGEVQLVKFIASCRHAVKQGEENAGPAYDRNCERDDYTKFLFVVSLPHMPEIPVMSWQPHQPGSGGQTLPWLAALGFTIEEGRRFYPAEVQQRLPLTCAVEMSGPRKDRNDPKRWYTGEVRAVFSV